MKRALIFQSPAFMYEVVPPFYREANKLGYFDTFYLATDHPAPYGLSNNVTVVQLEHDLGWEGNLTRLLDEVTEDLFVFMCDDHVLVNQSTLNLDPLFALVQANKNLGRLQLSPPSRNYARFLQARGLPLTIPDDSKPWYPYDTRYRFHLNFQPSIWRKSFLREVIKGGGNKSQLEVRASERARQSKDYISGYIGHYAMRYENFFASCQVHHTDPDFHKRNKKPHYREEFVRYAMKHNIELDPTKRVHVRRVFSASVPVGYYIQHYEDQEKYRAFAIKRKPVAQIAFWLGKRIRARVAPYVSTSSR